MNRWYDVPSEAQELVGLLSEVEPHITEDWGQCATGAGIMSATARLRWPNQLMERINVIPSRERGACHDTLLVVIRGRESDQMIDNRILS